MELVRVSKHVHLEPLYTYMNDKITISEIERMYFQID